MTVNPSYGGNESHRWPSGTIDPRVVFAPHMSRDVVSDERSLAKQQSPPCSNNIEDDRHDSVTQPSSTSISMLNPARSHSSSRKADVLNQRCLLSPRTIDEPPVHHPGQQAVRDSQIGAMQEDHTCNQHPVALSVVAWQDQSEHIWIQRSTSGRQRSKMNRPTTSSAKFGDSRIRAEKRHRYEGRSTLSLSNHRSRLKPTASISAVPGQSGRPGDGNSGLDRSLEGLASRGSLLCCGSRSMMIVCYSLSSSYERAKLY